MLGKLLKYELKATSRVFLPLYLTLLVVALINSFFVNSEMFQIQGLLMMVFGSLLIAMFVITFVVLLQRFGKNLLGDEGYLIFTLPVNSNSIILSKYLVALLWTLLSGIVAIIAFSFIAIIPLVQDLKWELSYIFNSIGEFSKLFFTKGFPPYVINFILLMFLGYSVFIFTVYLSLSMGQLPVFNKHRALASFISFIGLNILFSFVQNFITSFLLDHSFSGTINFDADSVYELYTLPNEIFPILNTQLISSTVFNLILLIGLFFATKYILDKKLNLE